MLRQPRRLLGPAYMLMNYPGWTMFMVRLGSWHLKPCLFLSGSPAEP